MYKINVAKVNSTIYVYPLHANEKRPKHPADNAAYNALYTGLDA